MLLWMEGGKNNKKDSFFKKKAGGEQKVVSVQGTAAMPLSPQWHQHLPSSSGLNPRI